MSRVLIVEDVAAMKELLSQVVAGIPGLQVSGKAANGFEARLELDRRRPDLMLLDEVLPGESSLDLLAEACGRGVRVILLTGMLETGISKPARLLPPGAFLRLHKPSWDSLSADRARFSEAIHQVLLEIPIAQRG